MDAQQVAEVGSWVDSYSDAARDLESGTVLATWAAYQAITDWYDPRQTVAAVTEAAAMILRMLDAVDGLVSAYQANVAAIITSRPNTRAARGRLEYPRGGADLRRVYDRPVWTYRDTIARGGTEGEAFQAARLHAELLAETDAILAERAATVLTFERQGVDRYRRVVRPELSESGTCGLCVAASDVIYSVRDLMPIHERCKCTVLPLVSGEDPAADLNRVDLEALYGAAGGKSRTALSKTRYRVDQHGELGPVLSAKSAARVDKTPAWDDPARAQRELAALLPVLNSLEARDAAGEDVSGPLGYQRDRITKLQRLLQA